MTSLILAPHRRVRRSISSDDPIACIDRVTDRLAECQLLVDLVLDRSRVGDNFPTLQDHQAIVTERPARPHRLRRPDSNLVIMATLEGHTTWCRPLLATGLCLADYEALTENPPEPYPFGLEGAGSAYHNTVYQMFIDHVERDHATDLYMIDPIDSGQPAPVVNMVAIR